MKSIVRELFDPSSYLHVFLCQGQPRVELHCFDVSDDLILPVCESISPSILASFEDLVALISTIAAQCQEQREPH